MLLSIFAFGLGCLIGRLRGGSWSGVTSARIHGTGWLVLGVTTILVLNLIGPAFPLVWALIGTTSFVVFGLKNLQITGMIVMLLGLFMNTAPLLANGAVPVSDLALQSVGQVDENGVTEISGLRESTGTATRLAAFGDVIPVPVVNSVVSLGDLVMLVALADIASNLFLRNRRRELDDAGVTYAEPQHAAPDSTDSTDSKHIEVLSPLNLGSRPAHAAHRKPRRKAAPSTHVPAHAKSPEPTPAEEPIAAEHAAHVEHAASAEHAAPAPNENPATEAPLAQVEEEIIDLTDSAEAAADTPIVDEEVVIDLTDPADSRPIIDLTVSPTDEQLCEFLRRRELADAEVDVRPAPGPRRGRAPRRSAGVAELHQ